MLLTNKYLKVNKIIERIEKILAVSIISSIVLIVFSGTVSRYILNSPIYGTDRLATYLMVWLGFLGFQIASSKGKHIEIEFLKSRVNPKFKSFLNIFSSILTFILLIIFLKLSIDYIYESYLLADTDLVLEIPIWYILLILPISFLFSAIRYFFIFLLWIDVLNGKRNEEEFIHKQMI